MSKYARHVSQQGHNFSSSMRAAKTYLSPNQERIVSYRTTFDYTGHEYLSYLVYVNLGQTMDNERHLSVLSLEYSSKLDWS